MILLFLLGVIFIILRVFLSFVPGNRELGGKVILLRRNFVEHQCCPLLNHDNSPFILIHSPRGDIIILIYAAILHFIHHQLIITGQKQQIFLKISQTISSLTRLIGPYHNKLQILTLMIIHI